MKTFTNELIYLKIEMDNKSRINVVIMSMYNQTFQIEHFACSQLKHL